MADELVDPDSQASYVRFQWDVEYQRYIMSLLLSDRLFLVQSIDLIRPSYFTNKSHQKICKILFDHFNQYKSIPPRIILTEELKTMIPDEKNQLFYLMELDVVLDYYHPGVESREYLQNKILFFAKIQAIKNGFFKCLKMIDKSPEAEETWSNVYEELRKSMSIERNYDIGLNYFNTYEDRYLPRPEGEEIEVFTSGFPSIDEGLETKGLCRGELGAFAGASGVGKSRALVVASVANIRRKKKVCYITMELSEQRVADRFDAVIANHPINMLFDYKDDVLKQLSYYNAQKCQLIIKKFPPSTADTNTIRAYVSQLQLRGYIPDLLIVDYLGEMKDYPGISVHESRERLVRELRGLLEENNMCGLTALQLNRGAKDTQKAGEADEYNLGDSYGQIRPLDALWTINQNEKEYAVEPNPLGRIAISKHRFGKSKYKFYIKFDCKTLNMYEISNERYYTEMNKQYDKDISKVNIDKVSQLDRVVKDAGFDLGE